jgi:hypothetical protein
MSPTIALMTDFGLDDTYVGVMKGVIQGICPDASVIDLTHNIEPQSVRRAAFSLLNAYRFFPDDTVFMVVIDPGVGTTRRPIAVRADNYSFIAPDNGVLSYTLNQFASYRAIELTNPAYRLDQVSSTFHGRDIFAPAAAHVATGVNITHLGGAMESIVQLPLPDLRVEGQQIVGEVVDIDHFGNITTSIGHLQWTTPERLKLISAFDRDLPPVPVMATQAAVSIHQQPIHGLYNAYGDAQRGELIALVGSSGYLEIAVNQGNAAQRLDVVVGDRVELSRGDVHAAIRD